MKKIITLSIFVLSLSAMANIDEKIGQCKTDVQTLCKDVTPGEKRIAHCLAAHEDKLSTECKQQRAEMKEQRKEFMVACKDDLKKHCRDTKRGKGRKFVCLKEHEAELTATCKTELGDLQAKKAE